MNGFRTFVNQLIAYGRSVIHPRTIFRTFYALLRGVWNIYSTCVAYIRADDHKELKEKNPTKHHEEVVNRRRKILLLIGVDIFLLAFLTFKLPPIVFLDNVYHVGFPLWAWIHIVLLFVAGRSEPVMVRVQTKQMAGESLIRNIVNDMTLSAALIKEGQSCDIVQSPTNLRNVKGYDTIVRVSHKGDPVPLLTKVKALEHKLQSGQGTVFTYQLPRDSSLIRITVLAENPWNNKPTKNPLVIAPRAVNLWQEPIDLGMLPIMIAWLRKLVEQGDGGGMLVGGAPRKGKSVFLSNILIALALNVMSRIHMIDGKAVDYPDLQPICATYVGDEEFEDIEVLEGATRTLEMLKGIIINRKRKMRELRTPHVTEKLMTELGWSFEWFVVDELAVITEDCMTMHKPKVMRFLELLQYVVRTGPAFGVYCILATQRPNEKSVPPSLNSMIVFRISFYIGTQAGSYSILGKAGPSYRADWLDPDQKGVGIAIGAGTVRPHLVEKEDLQKVVEYALALRENEVTPGIIKVYPAFVQTLIDIITRAEQETMSTVSLIEALADLGKTYTATSLSAELRPYGVGPKLVPSGVQTPRQVKGYRLADLTTVPKVVRITDSGVSQPVSETAGNPPEQWIATTEPEGDDHG